MPWDTGRWGGAECQTCGLEREASGLCVRGETRGNKWVAGFKVYKNANAVRNEQWLETQLEQT